MTVVKTWYETIDRIKECVRWGKWRGWGNIERKREMIKEAEKGRG